MTPKSRPRPAFSRSVRFAPALLALALLAVLLRAAIAPGYMWAPASDGALAVTLCSAHGQTTALIDLKTGALRSSKEADNKAPGASYEAPCLFAALAALAPPASPLQLANPAWTAHGPAPHGLHAIAPGRGLAAPPPWATGPPTLAA